MKLVTAVAVALAGAVAVGFFWGESRQAGKNASAPVPPTMDPKIPNRLAFGEGAPQLSSLKLEEARDAAVPIAEPLNAKVAYNENLTARVSSPIAGRIVALKAAAGDPVKAGDPLVVIDAPDLAAAVADLQKAEADESRKKFALERSRKLFEAEVIPRKDFESAEADFEQARAETLRAKRRLRNLSPAHGGENGLVLKAPVSGVVAERKANPSLEVQPGMQDPLFIVSDLRQLWVMIDLPEKYLKDVKPGLPIALFVEAYPGETFRGVVNRVGQVVNPDTRRVQVRCDVPNADGRLKPEMYARVSLLTDKGKRAIRVPNSALVTEGLYSYVFVEYRPRSFEKRRVEPVVQDREFAYLTNGINKGEHYVVKGALLLQSELLSGVNQSEAAASINKGTSK